LRLKEDNSSWKSRSIKRRDFRHDPGLPETEIPRQTGLKSKKTKHVHKYVERKLGKTIAVRFWTNSEGERVRSEYEVDKTSWVCEGCGNKKGHYLGRYYYW
jgi:hypothetical protein